MFGEVPIIIVTVIVFIQWVRDDHHTARRLDRQAGRDGDAELVAYNARLARLHADQARHMSEQGHGSAGYSSTR